MGLETTDSPNVAILRCITGQPPSSSSAGFSAVSSYIHQLAPVTVSANCHCSATTNLSSFRLRNSIPFSRRPPAQNCHRKHHSTIVRITLETLSYPASMALLTAVVTLVIRTDSLATIHRTTAVDWTSCAGSSSMPHLRYPSHAAFGYEGDGWITELRAVRTSVPKCGRT